MTTTYAEITFSDSDVVNPDGYIPKGEYNPHNVRPFLLHDHGFVLAVVFADCLKDAIDEAVDADKLDRYQLDPIDQFNRDDYGTTDEAGDWDWNDSVSFLGNAGEPFDIETLGAIELPNPPFSFCAMFAAALI